MTIPGFYDGVEEITPAEREMWAKLPQDDTAFAASIGVPSLPGEAGYSVLERLWARPTLDVNGIWGGYQGEGSKTVIAAKAGAKVSMRLVPGQDPERITQLITDYVPTIAPEGVKVEVKSLHGGQPIKVDADSPFVQAAGRALKRVYGRRRFCPHRRQHSHRRRLSLHSGCARAAGRFRPERRRAPLAQRKLCVGGFPQRDSDGGLSASGVGTGS